MELTNELLEQAMQRAEWILDARDHDGQWGAFRDLLEGEPAHQREAALHCLTLEIVRDTLVPGVDRQRWARLGWNRVLSGEVSPVKFVHELRMALAAGSRRGKL